MPKIRVSWHVSGFLVFTGLLLPQLARAASPYYLGPYSVGRETIDIVDPQRNDRRLRVDVWYPAAESSAPLTAYPSGPSRVAHQSAPIAAGESYPLVVYSHGHGMTSTGNTVYPESLASQGFIVAAPNHTGNIDGDLSSGEQSTVERPADVSFVIDELLAKSGASDGLLSGAIDADEIGVTGFSFGGFTTLATTTGVTQSGTTIPADPRVKAILPIARGSVYPQPIQPSDVTVPVLSIVGENDSETYGQVTADVRLVSSDDSYLAVLVGADHADVGTSFCQQSPEGGCANDLYLATISQLGTAFFSRYLKGDSSYDEMLTVGYAVEHLPKVEFWEHGIVDNDNDGRATLVEFGRLKESFGAGRSLATYSRGDFNRDRRIDLADFGLLKLNFSGPPTAFVPEPSGLTLAAAAGVVFLLCRGRGWGVQALLVAVLAPTTARADIFRRDDGNVIPGTDGITPRPGVDLSDWNTEEANLRFADLAGLDLNGAVFERSWLNNANFRGGKLDNARFASADLSEALLDSGVALTGADFSDAVLQRTSLSRSTSAGFTKEQLYSTASYKDKDLAGIELEGNDLSGWSFAGQDLTDAFFSWSQLAEANFTDAIVKGAKFDYASGLTKEQLYSTSSYKAKTLEGIRLEGHDLSGWSFQGQDLRNASLLGSSLTGATFIDAEIWGATWYGFTQEQLYSTASYKNRSLGDIDLGPRVVGYGQRVGSDLSGWNLNGQWLSGADLELADLSGADLSQAVLDFANLGQAVLQGATLNESSLYGARLDGATLADSSLRNTTLDDAWLLLASFANANLEGATLVDSDLRGADLRGAIGFSPDDTTKMYNLIWPDGHIEELARIEANSSLVVRNDVGDPTQNIHPIPIRVRTVMDLTEATRIELRFDENPWRSTISFEPDIPVTLADNQLWLQFTTRDAAIQQVGHTFTLFDWTGVSPVGEFRVTQDQVFVDAKGNSAFGIHVSYDWDLSRLYTTGEVTLLAAGSVIAGDATGDGRVDLSDFGVLKIHVGAQGTRSEGDSDGDGQVTLADFGLLKQNFARSASGNVAAAPEPHSLQLASLGAYAWLASAIVRRRGVNCRMDTDPLK